VITLSLVSVTRLADWTRDLPKLVTLIKGIEAMNATATLETSISRVKALKILQEVGTPDLFDPFGEYYLYWIDRREYLITSGQENPEAENHTTMSWL
jgi:hypothetical protein